MHTWLEFLKNDDYLNIKKHIKRGAKLDDVNEAGETVLACAIKERCSFDTLMLLIARGADIFDFDNEGVSIFDIAIAHNDIEMVNYLIEEGVDINKTSRRSGFTALMAAACYGRVEISKILISKGVNQKAKDSKGFTAIDFARKMNKKSILKILDYDEDDAQNRGYAR